MGVREDGRPTLASWPRRIYDWPELPARFGPALDSWRMRGLPPEHVTYIPKLHQHVSGMEYLTAWLGEEVLLLCDDGEGHLERTLIRRGEVTELTYGVRLLACSAAVALRQDHVQKQVDFRYNKTKEDVLLPVLNLLLGNPPDFRPRQAHPPTEALERAPRGQLCHVPHGKAVLPVWGRDPGQSVAPGPELWGRPAKKAEAGVFFGKDGPRRGGTPDGFLRCGGGLFGVGPSGGE